MSKTRAYFKVSALKRVFDHALKNAQGTPKILLVKDQGLYIMSGGNPRDIVSGSTSYVVYAKGCDPSKDEFWWDTCRDIAGGDDFGEDFEFSRQWAENLDKFYELEVTFTEDDISIRYHRKKTPSRKTRDGEKSKETVTNEKGKMIAVVKWIRQHQNGCMSIETFPITSISPKGLQQLRLLAKSGEPAQLENGEILWEINFDFVSPDEI